MTFTCSKVNAYGGRALLSFNKKEAIATKISSDSLLLINIKSLKTYD